MVLHTVALSAIFCLLFNYTRSLDQGGAAYPYYNEHCFNVSGSACKDIRECDLADAILALGGWPTVCGWVEGDADPVEWPKVCCGMPVTLEEPLKKKFAKQMARNKGSSTVKDGEPTGGGRCVLPLVPEPDTSVTAEDGVRFGNTPNSRQEFYKNSEFMSGIMNDSIFAMEFKTTGDSGVMFYVASSTNRRDYVGLFMQEGKIVYVFNCGMGSAVISSQRAYNDGRWHRAVFLRHGREGELIVDDQEEVSGSSIGKAVRIDHLDTPLYVGGVSEEVSSRGRVTLQGVGSSFPGCIRRVEAQDQPLTEGGATAANVSECSSKVEEGTFFSADGGHLVLYEKYRVGQRISVSLDIKPRNLSGVLLAVHGKEDYLVLQLVEGRVQFTVDSGSGPLTAHSHSPGNDLCDGEFHTIEAESKSNNRITLTVDGVSEEAGLDLESVSSIDTFDPLYVGGLPESSWSKGGVLTTSPFVGCMRDLVLDQERAPVEKSRLVGHVTLNSCPTM